MGAPTLSGSGAVDDAERWFVAFAAHELRGEITVQRALAEITLADPDADPAALREMAEQIAAACRRQERLLESLLTLARSNHGSLRRERVDLAATAGEALQRLGDRTLTVAARLGPAWTVGDPLLIARMVANLVENAERHNIPGGWIWLVTRTALPRASLTIANTGPAIVTAELSRIFRPFQRLSARHGGRGDGVGLGLAIVNQIAAAHNASIAASVRPGGGLRVEVDFPAGT